MVIGDQWSGGTNGQGGTGGRGGKMVRGDWWPIRIGGQGKTTRLVVKGIGGQGHWWSRGLVVKGIGGQGKTTRLVVKGIGDQGD